MLYLKAEIKDAEDTPHTLADELLACKLSLMDKGASTFLLTIWDPDKTVTGWLETGCEATFYVDTNSTPTTKRLVGTVESVQILKPSKGSRKLHVRGIDKFSSCILQRIVVESYEDKEVSLIVKDLLEKYAADFDGTTYVDETSTTLEDVRFNYRVLKECLDMLAEASGFTYYCDADLKVHWVEAESEDSGLSYGENDVAPIPEKEGTIEPTKCRVFLIGGTRHVLDQGSDEDVGYVSLKDYWYAQSFTPEWDFLSKISLKLVKVGSPDVLCGLICKDNSGPGEVVARFTYDPAYLEGTASWREAVVAKDLVKGEKFWIVLPKLGDVTNTVRWYHDDSSSGEHAYSSDGETWNVVSNSYILTYRTYFEVVTVAQAFSAASKDSYDWREVVIRDESIIDYDVAKRVAEAKLDELKDEHTVLSPIDVLDPVDVPQPGKTATLNISSFDVNAQFVVREVALNFEGGHKKLHKMQLGLGKVAEVLGKVLAETRVYLDHVALGKFGSEAGFLTLTKSLSSSLGLGDVLAAHVKSTWTIESSTFDGDDRLG